MSRPTVVLLHGIGSDSSAWDAVAARLEAELDVVALDLVGHGGRALPSGLPPTPAALALWAAEDIGALGLDRVHLAGHSLGGWVALELARLGRSWSVTAVAPGGLWSGGSPRATRALLRSARTAAVVGGRLARRPATSRTGRWLTLRLAVRHPDRVTPEQAAAMDLAMARADGFGDVLDALKGLRLDATDVEVPVTVVFGERDTILPARAQQRHGLPAQAVWVPVPDAGHVLVVERPDVVADAVLATVERAERARPRLGPAHDLSRFGFGAADERAGVEGGQSRDDTAAGWAERAAGNDARLLADRPPHW